MEVPTVPGLPPDAPLDGGFAAAHWLTKKPVPYLINPINPGLPLIVPPGRDPDVEFIRVIQRAFERWEDVKSSTLKYKFEDLTDLGFALDGKNVIMWGGPDLCTPFLVAFVVKDTVQILAPVPGTNPPLFTAGFLKPPPFVADFGTGHLFEISEAGQIIDADLVVCSHIQYSTTLAPGTVDLAGIALHEVGHVGGLVHSPIRGATMSRASVDIVDGFDDRHLRTMTQDDRAGISHLYPTNKFDSSATIEGRITIGSLFPGLPAPPPFVGIPLAPGSPAHWAHVVAVNAHGIVEASATTRADGKFMIRGLDGPEPYKLVVTHVSALYESSPFFLAGTLSPLVHFRPEEVTGVRLGQHVELSVHDALPTAGDSSAFLGIGNILPPHPHHRNLIGFVTDGFLNIEPSSVRLRRGQVIGNDKGPEAPFLERVEGTLFLFVTAADLVNPDQLPASIDLGPGITGINWLAGLGEVPGFGPLVVMYIDAQVSDTARKGLRNAVIVDRAGRKLVIPGVIEVR